MTAAHVLDGFPATSVTRRIVDLAAEGGLRPDPRPESRRGLYRVMVNGEGRDALFGCIDVSERTGRIVRAFLTHGNDGVERKHETVAEIRAVLSSWAAVQRTR